MRIQKEPIPNIEACPLESNFLEWHYVVTGPKDTPYEGGLYHGKLLFPKEYPYKPPGIVMLTPNGRFKTDTRLCLSMSDFHPETWNPLWSVSSILNGLLSFMLENSPTYGSMNATEQERRKLATQSLAFNVKNPVFNACFPHYKELHTRLLRQRSTLTSSENKESVSSPVIPQSNESLIVQTATGVNQHIQEKTDTQDRYIIFVFVCCIIMGLTFLYT